MPNSRPINQLDPFGDNKDEFETKGIRHSRSRISRNFFINLINPEDEKSRKRNHFILGVILGIIIVAILAIFLVPQLTNHEPQPEPEPLVNPTGREAASSDNIPSVNDPEARAYEQEKLDAVFSLLKQDDWEYTNALFETIFPNYLDACGKYDYYRAAIVLAKNFEGFSIPLETAESRAEELFKACGRVVDDEAENSEEDNDEDDITSSESPAD